MKRYSPDYLKELATDVFSAVGAPREEAAIVAEHLVTASLMGVDSHGIVRIPLYVRWVHEGAIVPGAPISVAKDEGTIAVLDCGQNFGQVAALRATELAIAKAREFKMSCVVADRCCHIGRLGHYTQLIAAAGMFGMVLVNSPKGGHIVVPFGGMEGRLSPNPISYAVPGPDRPILADMAMSTTAQGKVVVYRNQGKELPEGWIIDADGCPTTDPNALFGEPHGWILPMGGNIGYKGTAFLLLAEIMGSTLAGHGMIDDLPNGTNGACFIAIDISAFLPLGRFKEAISEMAAYVKSARPAPGLDEVLMPGETEFRALEDRSQNGIPVDAVTWESIRTAAESLGVSTAGG